MTYTLAEMKEQAKDTCTDCGRSEWTYRVSAAHVGTKRPYTGEMWCMPCVNALLLTLHDEEVKRASPTP